MANPLVTPLSETRHTGGFIVSEANNRRSRDVGTLITGNKLTAGTVLAKLTDSTGAPVYAATGGNTGNFTCGTVTESAGAIVGAYKGELINATHFNLFDPNGAFIGEGTFGVAFAGGGVGFTITAGGTAGVVGDTFTVTVAANAGAGKFTVFDPTLADGSQTAAGILYDDVDATSADQQCTVMTRSCEVNASELIWGANVTTTPQKTAAKASLALLGIISR